MTSLLEKSSALLKELKNMPKLEDFLTPKTKTKDASSSKKKWDFSDLNSLAPSPTNTSQRRPGRGTDIETSDKSTANLQQSGSKLAAQPTANLQQPASAQDENLQQSGSQTYSTSYSKVVANLQQSGSKPTAKTAAVTSLNMNQLVGLQRSVLEIIHRECFLKRSHQSGPVTTELISSYVKTDKKTTKNALQRLEKKGFIKVVSFKNGRGGWSNYEVPENIFQELITRQTYSKVVANLQQSGGKVVAQPTAQPTASSLEEEDSSIINKSSSSGISQTTKILEPLPKDWLEINFSELTALNIPFGQNHLRQILAHARVSAQELQESINHYAYDLRVTPGRKIAVQNHLGYFLNSLKNGPYAPPKGYKSPVEIARENYAASKKEEQIRLEKLNTEIFESEYSIWWNKLSLDEQKKITTSEGIRGKVESQRFFRDSVWPVKKEEMHL
jgi:predicted transcriptional regulator